MAEEKKKKPIGKIIAVVAVVLVVLAAIGGGNGGKDYSAESASSGDAASSTQESASSEQSEPEAKYAITDEVLDTSNPYSAYITGTLANNSGHDLKYVQVEYVLYDADGAQIGTAFTNTNNLKADGIWKFEALVFEDAESIASFELADVTAY